MTNIERRVLKDARQHYAVLKKRYFNRTIRTLIYIMDLRDEFNHRHSEHVVKYATKIAEALGLNRYELLRIRIAALLHDLGKYKIDKTILYKIDKLAIGEWNEIKKHPVTSAAIVRETGILDEITEIVKHHHERFGGGGYPDPSRQGNAIPLGSRIIAVADAYDAMTSKRSYREKALTQEEAISEIKRCVGTQFDPKVVAAFLAQFDPKVVAACLK